MKIYEALLKDNNLYFTKIPIRSDDVAHSKAELEIFNIYFNSSGDRFLNLAFCMNKYVNVCKIFS